jgi:hypothetical protein
MSIRSLLSLTLPILALAIGCASKKEFERIDALRRDPAWPAIRAAAEIEIARREGNTQWSHSAYYAPRQHTNSVWVVVASGTYPNNINRTAACT